jgi:hypothetical protein
VLRIRVDWKADDGAGRGVYDCLGEDGIDRVVWFANGKEVEEGVGEMTEEATFLVAHVEPWTAPDGMMFEAFTEYRLLDARRKEVGGDHRGAEIPGGPQTFTHGRPGELDE